MLRVPKIAREAEKRVQEVYRITPYELHAPWRNWRAVKGRYAVWVILKFAYGMHPKDIAKIYGKSRSTVVNGISRAVYLGIPDEVGITLWTSMGIT